MGFGSAVRSCFGKYASWQGRAPRSEFWWFQLFVVVVSFVLSALDAALGLVVDLGSETVETTSGPITFFNGDLGALSTIWAIVIFLPSLAVLVRRLHDTDRTGWWYWILLVPCIGPIVIIVFMLLPSTRGDNRFGTDPLNTSPLM